MKFRILLGVIVLCFSHQIMAKPNIGIHAAEGFGMFVKHEYNDTDSITGVGVSQRLKFNRTEFGAEVTTNLNYAEVLTQSGNIEEFLAWEGGVRLGSFSTIFVYVEAGIDLTETFFNDRDDDDCCSLFEPQENDPDGYAGIGLGLELNHLRIEGSVRARQIDSTYWRNESSLYYGVQLSVIF